MKKIITVLFSIILMLTMTKVSLSQEQPNARPILFNLTTEQWRADLRYFSEELPKRHKNAYHHITKEQFELAVKTFDAEIPKLNSDEIFVRFIKIMAMLGDGHSSIEEQSLLGLGLYPIRYEIFQDGLFVQSARAEFGDIVGGKVVRIGNTPVDEVMARVKEISWGDNRNEQSLKVESSFLLSCPRVVRGLNLADSNEKVSVTVENNGQQKTVELKAVVDVRSLFSENGQKNANDNAADPKPLYLKDLRNNYWFEYIKESKILFVQFNANQNKTGESIAAFFKRVFDFADANPVDKFVLDVRMNTGGNLLLNKPIIIGLIRGKFNERGKLFIVIGRRTFSAAQYLVNELEKYSNAIFVGEPTGSSPNLFGDPIIMTLPNSKMPFRVATLYHQTDPTDKRNFTTPDIFTPLTSKDYRNNVDPAFQAILNYVPGSTFKDLAAHGGDGADISGFINAYREFKTSLKNQYVNTETDMNALGYRLIQAKRIKDALKIFKLNVEAYPVSANAYDSVAEAYLLDGNREEAIKNYEKALHINPNFQSSADALKKLKASPQ